MTAAGALLFLAGVIALLIAGASLVRRTPSAATWLFVGAMTALAAGSLSAGMAVSVVDVSQARRWLVIILGAKAVAPTLWLGFGLAYSRADGHARVRRWAVALLALGMIPLTIVAALGDRLFDLLPSASTTTWTLTFRPSAAVLSGFLLVTLVLSLLNLEQTFRASVGTMRWRLKYVVLGLVVILGTRVYGYGQTLLFSSPNVEALWNLEALALLIGCSFLAFAHVRTGTGWTEVTVYPSSVVIRSSLTVLIVGGYLLTIGVLAQLVDRIGGATFLRLQSSIVLLALTGLAVLMLSDRARQRLRAFTASHFGKSQHDSVKVWASVSEQCGTVRTTGHLAAAAGRFIVTTFDVLSVNIWFSDEHGRLALASSTNSEENPAGSTAVVAPVEVARGLSAEVTIFDLDAVDMPWAETFRALNPRQFDHGGRRLAAPLLSATGTVGALVLMDRVSGAPYTGEDRDLLRCMAAQITSVLLTLKMADEVARARELEAFRNMSTFFVHDLKNAAASLNLMLKNLPVHFDDPAFRADAFRGIGNVARRIDDTIVRLSTLRDRPELARTEANLNDVVNEALEEVPGAVDITVTTNLEPLPTLLADRDQLRSVVANLVMNAREAIHGPGRINISTSHRSGEVELSVTDTGCGMSETFISTMLFKPFHTTKKAGLGIGLFQTRAIVEAHGGRISVKSSEGHGATFAAIFPLPGHR